jgi:hypothetical protein
MMLTGGIDDEDGKSYFDETGTPDGPPAGPGAIFDNSAIGGPRRALAQPGAYLLTNALNGFSRKFERTRLASWSMASAAH